MQLGGAIAIAIGAAFLARWWMRTPGAAWAISADGAAWEATRDCNGALLLPERQYRMSGESTAPAQFQWILRDPEGGMPDRSGVGSAVSAGQWGVDMRMGTDAPRRAEVTVRISPASAVRVESLRIELSR